MSIDERPKEVETRKEFEHYEVDTAVIGRGSKSALLTVIERKNRKGFTLKLVEKKLL